MGKNLDKMKKAVDAGRKANGEPPRPRPTPTMPSPKKRTGAKPVTEIVDMNELIDCVVEGAKEGTRTVRMTRAECLAKYGHPGDPPQAKEPAPGPEKPSEATEAVLDVIVESYELSHGDIEFLTNDTMQAIATALVRRFPGLTHRPKSKHRRCCGTLAGSAPHEPDCREHPDTLAAHRAKETT